MCVQKLAFCSCQEEEESIVGPPLPERHYPASVTSGGDGMPEVDSGPETTSVNVDGGDDDVRPRSYSKAKPLAGENRCTYPLYLSSLPFINFFKI